MTQTRTLLFAVLLFPQVLKAADPRDSSSASSRRIKVAVGRIQEGGQVRNIHNQVALGLGDMVSRLGYFDVIDVRAFYALIPDAVKKAKGGLTLAPQADAAKAQGIPNVLIGKVLRADVGREAVRSAEGDRPLWEVRAHVEFEYQFVDSGSRQILATGRATGEAVHREARSEPQTVNLGGIIIPGSAPKATNFDDNILNADLAGKAAREACWNAAGDVIAAFPLSARVLELLDAKKRLARIDAGGDLGIRKGDHFVYSVNQGAVPRRLGAAKVEEALSQSSVVRYQKELDGLVKPGISLQFAILQSP